jgi:hypothetical protein
LALFEIPNVAKTFPRKGLVPRVKLSRRSAAAPTYARLAARARQPRRRIVAIERCAGKVDDGIGSGRLIAPAAPIKPF